MSLKAPPPANRGTPLASNPAWILSRSFSETGPSCHLTSPNKRTDLSCDRATTSHCGPEPPQKRPAGDHPPYPDKTCPVSPKAGRANRQVSSQTSASNPFLYCSQSLHQGSGRHRGKSQGSRYSSVKRRIGIESKPLHHVLTGTRNDHQQIGFPALVIQKSLEDAGELRICLST